MITKGRLTPALLAACSQPNRVRATSSLNPLRTGPSPEGGRRQRPARPTQNSEGVLRCRRRRCRRLRCPLLVAMLAAADQRFFPVAGEHSLVGGSGTAAVPRCLPLALSQTPAVRRGPSISSPASTSRSRVPSSGRPTARDAVAAVLSAAADLANEASPGPRTLGPRPPSKCCRRGSRSPARVTRQTSLPFLASGSWVGGVGGCGGGGAAGAQQARRGMLREVGDPQWDSQWDWTLWQRPAEPFVPGVVAHGGGDSGDASGAVGGAAAPAAASRRGLTPAPAVVERERWARQPSATRAATHRSPSSRNSRRGSPDPFNWYEEPLAARLAGWGAGLRQKSMADAMAGFA